MRRHACLFAIAFFVYNLNLRPIPSGDTAPAALLPLTIVAEHTTSMDGFAEWCQGAQHMQGAWFRRAQDGHYYSSFPIALPLLLTPLYSPFILLDLWHMPVDRVLLLARVLEKVSASLIAACSVVAFLALARKLTDGKTAWLLAMVYAFGSPTWSISSQALWQHGASELAIQPGTAVFGARERESQPSSRLYSGRMFCRFGRQHPAQQLGILLAGRPIRMAVAMALSTEDGFCRHRRSSHSRCAGLQPSHFRQRFWVLSR